jgi:hypothetical protein
VSLSVAYNTSLPKFDVVAAHWDFNEGSKFRRLAPFKVQLVLLYIFPGFENSYTANRSRQLRDILSLLSPERRA